MSSPTIDYLALERRKKEELERQRQEKLRRVREATDKLNIEISNVKANAKGIENHYSREIGEATSSEMEITISDLTNLKSLYSKKQTSLLNISIPAEPEEILSCASNLKLASSEIAREFSDRAISYESRINDFVQQRKNRLEEFSDNQHKVHKISIKGLQANNSASEFCKDIIMRDIEETVNTDFIQASDKRTLLGIAAKMHDVDANDKKKVKSLVSEYSTAKACAVRNGKIFSEAYNAYVAEHVTWIGIRNARRNTPLQTMRQFESIEALDDERKLVAQKAKKTMQTNEIRKHFDEVMNIFGYDTSEDAIFENNPEDRDFVCESNKSKTALHVSVTDDNKILMEVVAFEKCHSNKSNPKSIIEDSLRLSEDEVSMLVNEQKGFCEIHPRIVEELKKRGVILNEHSRVEPDSKKCKKIKHFCGDYAELATKLYNPLAGESSDETAVKVMRQSIK